MKIDFKDLNNLSGELQRLNSVRFDAVELKQLTQMRDRAVAPGGTPVSTRRTRPGPVHGELRKSVRLDEASKTLGYTKEYAAHVEYGHRVVSHGKTVGYVEGQRFLLRNFQKQQPIFFKDLLKEIKKEL